MCLLRVRFRETNLSTYTLSLSHTHTHTHLRRKLHTHVCIYMRVRFRETSASTRSLSHTHTQTHAHAHTCAKNVGIRATSASSRCESTMRSAHCNTLQHTATHCNTLQHTATVYPRQKFAFQRNECIFTLCECDTQRTPQHSATHCDTHTHMQHIATHSATHILIYLRRKFAFQRDERIFTLRERDTQRILLVMLTLNLSLYVVRVSEHMCCSVLQCVAVCCSVLQCVAVCCSNCVSRHADNAPQPVCIKGARAYVLQCVAVCCRVLQCVAAIFFSTR